MESRARVDVVVVTIPVAVLIALAVLLVITVTVLARLSTQRARTLESVTELAVPVDIAALHTLLSKADDAFLRARLPHGVYRALRRRRSKLILSYIRIMLHNTAVLLSFASAVRDQGDATQAAVANEVIYTAMRVRLLLAWIACRTVIELGLPFLSHSPEPAMAYLRLVDRSADLFRILDPMYNSRFVTTG